MPITRKSDDEAERNEWATTKPGNSDGSHIGKTIRRIRRNRNSKNAFPTTERDAAYNDKNNNPILDAQKPEGKGY